MKSCSEAGIGDGGDCDLTLDEGVLGKDVIESDVEVAACACGAEEGS